MTIPPIEHSARRISLPCSWNAWMPGGPDLQQPCEFAVRPAHAQETVGKDAAFVEGVELAFDELRQVGSGGHLCRGDEGSGVLPYQAPGLPQFGNADIVLLVSSSALGIHILSGKLLTPWLTSRANRSNAVCVFVGVLAFGWRWANC